MPRAESSATVSSIDGVAMTMWLNAPPAMSTVWSGAGSWTSSMVTNSSPGSFSIVRSPIGVAGTRPTIS